MPGIKEEDLGKEDGDKTMIFYSKKDITEKCKKELAEFLKTEYYRRCIYYSDLEGK